MTYNWSGLKFRGHLLSSLLFFIDEIIPFSFPSSGKVAILFLCDEAKIFLFLFSLWVIHKECSTLIMVSLWYFVVSTLHPLGFSINQKNTLKAIWDNNRHSHHLLSNFIKLNIIFMLITFFCLPLFKPIFLPPPKGSPFSLNILI